MAGVRYWWLGEVMVKSGERGIACGLGHEKDVGLGHTLMGDSAAYTEWHSREEMKIEKEREKMELAILVVEFVVWFEELITKK